MDCMIPDCDKKAVFATCKECTQLSLVMCRETNRLFKLLSLMMAHSSASTPIPLKDKVVEVLAGGQAYEIDFDELKRNIADE